MALNAAAPRRYVLSGRARSSSTMSYVIGTSTRRTSCLVSAKLVHGLAENAADTRVHPAKHRSAAIHGGALGRRRSATSVAAHATAVSARTIWATAIENCTAATITTRPANVA